MEGGGLRRLNELSKTVRIPRLIELAPALVLRAQRDTR